MLSQTCIHCGKTFDGNKNKFCSQSCKDSHIADLARRIHEAIDDDPGHTERLAKD